MDVCDECLKHLGPFFTAGYERIGEHKTETHEEWLRGQRKKKSISTPSARRNEHVSRFQMAFPNQRGSR